jgi:hypothetical protein
MIEKDIIIKKIENKDNDFIAFFKSDFLKATFCICFKDTIFGAVALNDFFQMIKHKYNSDKLNLVISEDKIKIKNSALLDQILKEESSYPSKRRTEELSKDYFSAKKIKEDK